MMNGGSTSSAFEKIITIVVLLLAAWFILWLLGSILRIASAILSWVVGVGIWVLVAYGLWYLLFGRRRSA